MKGCLSSLIMALILAASGFAVESQVRNIDGSISIDVDNMRLGYLLRLWDQATGMRSSIPPDLTNQTITLHFSGLQVDEAVEKIFANLDLDYVFVEGQGIIVTGVSQQGGAEPAPVYAEAQEVTEAVPEQQREIRQPRLEPPQPQVIQTPFGPIPKTSAGGNPIIQLPPVREAPPPPFFAPVAEAPNGRVQDQLFRPISIYRNPSLPPIH